MPIWLRKFTFTKLQEHYENQAKELQKTQGKSTINAAPPKGPNISKPTYTTKAGK